MFFITYSAVKIGRLTMSIDEIVENIMVGIKNIASHFSKRMKAIQSIHIKTNESIALPIYNGLIVSLCIIRLHFNFNSE